MPDRLNALKSMLDNMRSSVRCHNEFEFVGEPGRENAESQNDLTPGDKGQRTAHATSQRLWMIVYYIYEAIY